MALVTEDGTGLANAESYVSVSDADAYWAARPHAPRAATWSGKTTAEKEGALREATGFLDAEYGPRFLGRRKAATQALAWPRVSNELDDDGEPLALTDADGLALAAIPPQLVRATIEAAVDAVSGALVSASDRDGIQRAKVGDVETTFFDGKGPLASIKRALGSILAPLLDGEAGAPSWRWR